MSSITYQSLDNRLANFEKTLNTLGYIPGVSTVSGPGRCLYGMAENITGNVLFHLKACQYLITGNLEHRNQAAAHYWYAMHGAMNSIRGALEAIPIAGNITTLFYDHVACLRANYTYEYIALGTLPIFDPSKSEIVF